MAGREKLRAGSARCCVAAEGLAGSDHAGEGEVRLIATSGIQGVLGEDIMVPIGGRV